MQINFNGHLFPADQPIFKASNRAFRYGDGLFETIRVFDGQMPFFQRHWQRLMLGFSLLGFDKPTNFTPYFFENEIAKLTANSGNWRVRLSVWRGDGGLYSPTTNFPEFLIEAATLPNSKFEINESGLVVNIYQKHLLLQTPPDVDTPSLSFPLPVKTSSALHQVLAAISKQEAGLDDCLMLNTAGQLACATSSNIFLVNKSELISPPIEAGALAGTMRATLLDLAGQLGIQCHESPINPNELHSADEIFLTNAVQGIRWVGRVVGIEKSYGCTISTRLVQELNTRFLARR